MPSKTDNIRQSVGQLFLVGFDGTKVPAEFRKALQLHHLGGVIYFKRNVQSAAQLAELSNEIQFSCRTVDMPPLFISIDHEGGKVNRLGKPFTKFPSIENLGVLNSPKMGFEFGAVLGRELKAIGVNIDYAPVCDVLTNPKNPIMAERCFGSDPELVGKLASAVCRGIQKMGVIAVAKHFPGHGDTLEDSHLALPRIDKALPDMERTELAPFRRVTRSRVEGVMTAHILNSSLDPDWPATMSHRTIEGLLRGDMRYNRLVFTDDMEMQAITDHYGADDAAVKSIAAGCDILIYRGDAGFPAGPYEAIVKAVEKGVISRERLEQSVHRIQAAKRGYCQVTKPIDVAEVERSIGLPEHTVLAEAIAKRELPKGFREDANV